MEEQGWNHNSMKENFMKAMHRRQERKQETDAVSDMQVNEMDNRKGKLVIKDFEVLSQGPNGEMEILVNAGEWVDDTTFSADQPVFRYVPTPEPEPEPERKTWAYYDEQRQVWHYIDEVIALWDLDIDVDLDGKDMFKEVEVIGRIHRALRERVGKLQSVIDGLQGVSGKGGVDDRQKRLGEHR